MQRLLKIGYGFAYLAGLTAVVLSLVLASSVQTGADQAFAQGSWSVTQVCGGFTLSAPAHPAIEIRADFAPTNQGPWGGLQTWTRNAGGPANYNFSYSPQPPVDWEVRVQVIDTSNGNVLFRDLSKVAACPSPTLPPPPTFTPTPGEPTPTPEEPTPTPDTPTPTVQLPTDTPTPDTPTPTPEEPTITPTGPTDTPTPTPTGPTPTPSATSSPTPTDTATPTPTNTPVVNPPTTVPPPAGNTATPIQPPPGTPAELVPVTGIDLSGGAALNTGLLQNVGLGLLGLGLVLHGISLRTRKDK